jgi:hypothetical protein
VVEESGSEQFGSAGTSEEASMNEFVFLYAVLLLCMVGTGVFGYRLSRVRKELVMLKSIAGTKFRVLRNPDGGNGPGMVIVEDTFEHLYLLAKYGGMTQEDDVFALNTAYGTMRLHLLPPPGFQVVEPTPESLGVAKKRVS